MAVTAITTIKNWFKTGLIPTQSQFWSIFDSYRHKNDKVPVADVEGIDELLVGKASAGVLNTHLSAEDAHEELFGSKVGKYILSNEGLELATRKGDLLYGILDQYTGEELTLRLIDYEYEGSPTVDGIIYFQLGTEYFKRVFEILNVKWFGSEENVLKINSKLSLGDGSHSVDDSLILLNRDITDGGGTTGYHAVRDETLYSTDAVSGLRAYASFDAIPKMQGSAHYNHLHAFQARPDFSGSDIIDAIRGFTYQGTYNGNVDYSQALFIDDYLGSGTVNQNTGLHIRPLIKGLSNFAIFIESSTPSYLGDGVVQAGNFTSITNKISGLSGSYGQVLAVDTDGNIIGNPNLTIINGTLDMKAATAKVFASATDLKLESIYGIQIFTGGSGGSKKAEVNYDGRVLLGATDNTVDKVQIEGTLKISDVMKLAQFTNATEPIYALGSIFMNSELGKIRVGGASAWETVTSV